VDHRLDPRRRVVGEVGRVPAQDGVAARRQVPRVAQPRAEHRVAVRHPRGRRRGDHDGVAAQRARPVTGDDHGLGRLGEERLGQSPPALPPVRDQPGGDPRRVALPHAVDAVPGRPLPAVERAQHRRLDQVGEVDGHEQVAGQGAGVQAVGDPAPQLALALGLAGAEVGAQRPPDQLVQRQAVGLRHRVRPPGEPRECRCGVDAGQHVPQQSGRRDPGEAGHRQHVAVVRVVLAVDQVADQRPEDRVRLAGLARAPLAGPDGPRREGEGERRTGGPRHQAGGIVGIPDALGAEQGAGVGRRERSQLELAHDPLPAAGEPAPLGRPPAGDDHGGATRQRRQHHLAQVRAERGGVLVAVDQHERVARGTGRRQRVVQRPRHGRQAPGVDGDDGPPGSPGPPGRRPQEGALADPPGAVHEHDARRRLGCEAHVDHRQLLAAADERGSVPGRYPCSDRHRP
jgi:hypothetical protein